MSYLPQCTHRSILVTTRSQDKALNLVKQRDIIVVDLISCVDTRTLFKKKLGGDDDSSNNADISTKLLVVLEFMLLTIV